MESLSLPRPALARAVGRLARARRPIAWAAGGLLALLLALLPAFPPAAAEPAGLAAVRFGQQGRFTRIVLDLDRQLPVEVRLERAPARLLLDLPELRLPAGQPATAPRGLAQAIRPAPLGGGTRLVVELAAPAELVARFWIPPGRHSDAWRLVVDLEPEGATRPPERAAAEPLPPLPRPRPEGAAAAHRAAREAAAAQPAAGPVGGPPAPANGTLATPAEPRLVIAIDPGHGGGDPGTIGVDGLKEKDIVLAMGLEIAQALEATGRYWAALTRRTDVGLALRERIKVARDAGAQLFLSLHADSLADPQVAGASVYTLSETASDEEAALLAAKENKADILASTDLSRHDPIVASILIDLAQRDTLNKSIELAQALSAELEKVTPLLRNHRRYAGFAVLKSPEMPSALVELGYLSSPEDARRLADPRHRHKLAQAILAAIDRHLRTLK